MPGQGSFLELGSSERAYVMSIQLHQRFVIGWQALLAWSLRKRRFEGSMNFLQTPSELNRSLDGGLPQPGINVSRQKLSGHAGSWPECLFPLLCCCILEYDSSERDKVHGRQSQQARNSQVYNPLLSRDSGAIQSPHDSPNQYDRL